jgi:hypothetical protein
MVRPDDVVVDNTLLEAAARCDTLVAMRHILHLAPAEEAKELRAGSAVHEVLAAWLSGASTEEALGRLNEYRQWAKEHVPPDDRLRYQNVKKIVAFWLKRHPLQDWPFLVNPAQVEMPLTAPLGVLREGKLARVQQEWELNDPKRPPMVVMVALLDAVGKHRKSGGLWSVDHKTTSNTGEWFKSRQENSSQFTGQMWIARERDLLLSGVFINGIHLREVPSSNGRCKQHGTTYAECGNNHPEHVLFPVTRTPHELDAWETTARRLTRRFLVLRGQVRTIEDARELPMQGRFNGACGFCPFQKWCRSGRLAGAAKTFTEQPWRPLEHAGVGTAGAA